MSLHLSVFHCIYIRSVSYIKLAFTISFFKQETIFSISYVLSFFLLTFMQIRHQNNRIGWFKSFANVFGSSMKVMEEYFVLHLEISLGNEAALGFFSSSAFLVLPLSTRSTDDFFHPYISLPRV